MWGPPGLQGGPPTASRTPLNASAAGFTPQLGQESFWMQETHLSSLEADAGDFGRVAKGSAGVQEIVSTTEANPWAVITSFEMRMAREEGATMPGASWSTTRHAERVTEKVAGHVALKKALVMIGQILSLVASSARSWPRMSGAEAIAQAPK